MKYNFFKKPIIIFLCLLIVSTIGLINHFYDATNHQSNDKQSKILSQSALNYLFVASWSPAYCAEHDPQGHQTQCKHNLKKKFRFIIHGLWPQSQSNQQKVHYLNYCKAVDKDLEGAIIDTYLYLMPSSTLMKHQWTKHGSCGDFTPRTYFAKIQELYKKFKIAALFSDIETTQSMTLEAIIAKITKQVSTITANNIVVKCQKNIFKEIRFCLNDDYTPRQCGLHELKGGTCRKNEKIIIKF
jgi:ribonuclease T2